MNKILDGKFEGDFVSEMQSLSTLRVSEFLNEFIVAHCNFPTRFLVFCVSVCVYVYMQAHSLALELSQTPQNIVVR